MTPVEYAFLARFLRERSGLVLGEDKRYLVDSRLGPVARKAGLASVGALVAALMRRADDPLGQAVVEAMTTNETFFFRDSAPFAQFTDVILPHLVAARRSQKRVRIWCAACSNGQEPYSLAMLLEERAAELAGIRFEIVATDISGEVIDRAKEGFFSQFEVQRGLPIKLLLKHFTQEGDRWRIAKRLRENVQFRTLNLLRDFSPLGAFDVVFCRNVLIYFDEAAKTDVLKRIGRQLAPDGFMLLGAAETVFGLDTPFKAHPTQRSLFVPAAAAAAAPAAPRFAVVGR